MKKPTKELKTTDEQQLIEDLITKAEDKIAFMRKHQKNLTGKDTLWAVYHIWNSEEYSALEEALKKKTNKLEEVSLRDVHTAKTGILETGKKHIDRELEKRQEETPAEEEEEEEEHVHKWKEEKRLIGGKEYFEEISTELGYTVKPNITIIEWIELDRQNTDLKEWC